MTLKNIALVVGFTFLTGNFAAQAAQYPISSGRTPQQKADSLFEMVGKELTFTPKTKDKFKAIQAVINQFRQMLNGEEEVKPEETAYIKDYLVALQSLPQAKGFKKSHCDEYQVEEKAKALLQSLCDDN